MVGRSLIRRSVAFVVAAALATTGALGSAAAQESSGDFSNTLVKTPLATYQSFTAAAPGSTAVPNSLPGSLDSDNEVSLKLTTDNTNQDGTTDSFTSWTQRWQAKIKPQKRADGKPVVLGLALHKSVQLVNDVLVKSSNGSSLLNNPSGVQDLSGVSAGLKAQRVTGDQVATQLFAADTQAGLQLNKIGCVGAEQNVSLGCSKDNTLAAANAADFSGTTKGFVTNDFSQGFVLTAPVETEELTLEFTTHGTDIAVANGAAGLLLGVQAGSQKHQVAGVTYSFSQWLIGLGAVGAGASFNADSVATAEGVSLDAAKWYLKIPFGVSGGQLPNLTTITVDVTATNKTFSDGKKTSTQKFRERGTDLQAGEQWSVPVPKDPHDPEVVKKCLGNRSPVYCEQFREAYVEIPTGLGQGDRVKFKIEAAASYQSTPWFSVFMNSTPNLWLGQVNAGDKSVIINYDPNKINPDEITVSAGDNNNSTVISGDNVTDYAVYDGKPGEISVNLPQPVEDGDRVTVTVRSGGNEYKAETTTTDKERFKGLATQSIVERDGKLYLSGSVPAEDVAGANQITLSAKDLTKYPNAGVQTAAIVGGKFEVQIPDGVTYGDAVVAKISGEGKDTSQPIQVTLEEGKKSSVPIWMMALFIILGVLGIVAFGAVASGALLKPM